MASLLAGLLLMSFHFDGKRVDPYNLAFYLGLITIIFSLLHIAYESWSSRYSGKQLEVVNHFLLRPELLPAGLLHLDRLDLAQGVLAKYARKNQFQYMSIWTHLGLFSEIFVRLHSKENDFARRSEVYQAMKQASEECRQKINKTLSREKSSVLRFVYDFHPGGAFMLGDCIIEEGGPSGMSFYVLGYTDAQRNVTRCAKILGYIIDDIRKSGVFGNKMSDIAGIKD